MSENSVNDYQTFLEGKNPDKYIVAIEGSSYSNRVDLVYNNPLRSKKSVVSDVYKPFLWCKDLSNMNLYKGDKSTVRKKMKQYGISFKELELPKNAHTRIINGYRYIIYSDKSFNSIKKFFEEGGINIYGQETRKLFQIIKPEEQYLIQTGKRLFKGFEDYNDLHRLQFDIETRGINPETDLIFSIGIKDNKGFSYNVNLVDCPGDTINDKECKMIEMCFELFDTLKPDIIAGYNSANFDWDFLIKRYALHGKDIKDIVKTMSKTRKMYVTEKNIKFGAESERYNQVSLYGYNVLDVSHTVRRAQAINSSIKSWSLKYITKFADANKPDRVYVPGDMIFKTAFDSTTYYIINKKNGDWRKMPDDNIIPEGYEKTTGKEIVDLYLADDLWETEKVDMIFNQSNFLLGKILPTKYERVCTMGTAAVWKLIMLGWSYENKLIIPDNENNRSFTGGLSKIIEVGYNKRLLKLDFASLYPSIMLTHGCFPELDYTNSLQGLLTYTYDQRNFYKYEAGRLYSEGNEELASLYDKKQLPLKILNNGIYGAISAPHIFNWGSMDIGEMITCTGRQYLRQMIEFFKSKGYKPVVMDTDGVNFAIPENRNDVYVSDGTHRFNEKGKKYTGTDAVVAEYNDKFMFGRMGLDVDEIIDATINISRKNYANYYYDKKKNKEKIKLTGNTIKSKTMPTYIKEFLDDGIKLLLLDKGDKFIELYYDYVEKIVTNKMPAIKIASVSRVKDTPEQYEIHRKSKNKAGNTMPKKAHMELLRRDGIKKDLGSNIYFINTGTKKSHSDIKTKKDKILGGESLIFYCEMLDENLIETDPNYTVKYNVEKYISAFNERVSKLLIVFDKKIRDKILATNTDDFQYFTKDQLKMTSNQPNEVTDQDDIEDVLVMEDKEYKFWKSVNKNPFFMYKDVEKNYKFVYRNLMEKVKNKKYE